MLRPRVVLLCAILFVPGVLPGELRSQPAEPASPATVADEFLRAVEAIAWPQTAHRMHPDALETFRRTVSMLVRTDETGEVLARLLREADPAEYEELEAPEVFTRVMTALLRETPGLVNALVGRRHEILGTVTEGTDRAHVLYRVIPDLTGAEPELRIVTLAPEGGRWRVLEAEELASVRTALRGLPIGGRRPPPSHTSPAPSRESREQSSPAPRRSRGAPLLS